MKLPHTNIKLIAASLMCGLVIVSCKKDETISVSEEPAVESDIVSFDISASGSWAPDVIGDEAQTPTRSGQYTPRHFLWIAKEMAKRSLRRSASI